MTSVPLVSIVLLSYNRPVPLRRALASACNQEYPALEVLVIDNHSPSSGEIAEIVSRFPLARLIAHPQNLGFTGGMNSGIRAARGDFVYLTEDDIEMGAETIRTLVAHLQERTSVGLTGPVMLNRADATVRCAGGFVKLESTYHLTILREPFGPLPYVVDYLPGASMMARRSLLGALGGFREEFFMYGEDVELCTRVQRAGFEISVVPGAFVTHDDPPAGTVPSIEFHKIKNFVSLYLIHARWSVLPSFVARYGVFGLVRALLEGQGLVHLRAWMWALAHMPRLVAGRLGWPHTPSAA